MKDVFLRAFHIIFVTGLFLYIGIARIRMPAWMYPVLLGLSVLVFAYHAYKSLFKKEAFLNYFHMLAVSPLLAYVALKREATPPFAFEVVLVLAVFTLGHHSLALLR